MLYNMVMDTTLFQSQVQQRVRLGLGKLCGNRDGFTLTDLNHWVVRCANGILLERRLNHTLWTRIYRDRVFVYNIKTRRAVLELGCISDKTERTNQDGKPLLTGFSLYIMGGIYNKPVCGNLAEYVRESSNKMEVSK